MFPPGYSGNYLQWIINISEESKKELTINNPLLPNGTTHAFVRKPTHMGLLTILPWIIKNTPSCPQTYVVYANTGSNSNEHPAFAAFNILKSYPDALIVNIHTKTDDVTKVGALNGYTKWTTWIYDTMAFDPAQKYEFDWEGGKNGIISISDRNWLLEHWRKFFVINDQPFNWKEQKYNIEGFKNWLKVRKELEPNESDSEQFNNFEPFPFKNIFDIGLDKIYSPDFFENTKFTRWIDSQNVGKFDWEYAKGYHQTYLDAQDNLQWFSDIGNMREHRLVSKWLLKHTLGQAFVLEEVKDQLAQVQGWQEKHTEEILYSLGYKIVN